MSHAIKNFLMTNIGLFDEYWNIFLAKKYDE